MRTARRLARVFAAAAVAALIGSCSGEAPTSAVPAGVSAVQLSPGVDTLFSVGQTVQFTAVVKDADGNTLTGRTVAWTSSAPSVATVNATTGLVTAIANGAASIQATAEGVNGAAQVFVAQLVKTVTVTPGNTALTTIGSTQAFTAVATDSGGTAVSIPRFIWLSSDPYVATVDTLGVATARHSGQATITAAGQGIPGNAVLSVSQDAAQLAYRVNPPATTVAGDPFASTVQVEVRDAGGALVPDAQIPVTLTASAGTLKGSTTSNAINGVASFSGLYMEQSGTGLTLSATSAALPPVSSAAFSITSAAPVRLSYATPPATDTAGAPLNVVVQFRDRFGNVATGATDSVHVHLFGGPSGGELFGDTAAAPVAGVATFATLNLHLVEAGYRLRAAVKPEGIDSTLSDYFNVTPATAVKLTFEGGPYGAIGYVGAFGGIPIAVRDTFNNLAPAVGYAVHLRMPSSEWMPSLYAGGSAAHLSVDGMVDFSTARSGRPGAHTLVAEATGLRPDTSQLNVGLQLLALSAGYEHICAASYDGSAYCWGRNSSGQLGQDSTSAAGDSVAAVVSDFHYPIQITSGTSHSCMVDNGQQAWCWGDNASGQLGTGTAGGSSTVPVQVTGGHAWVMLTAGDAFTCGIAVDTKTYCWGENADGELGDASAEATTATPVVVSGTHAFFTIDAGALHVCAVDDANAAYCWGKGDAGQLGQAAFTGSDVPVAVSGGHQFSYVSAGGFHTCGVVPAVSPQLWCWGDNTYGQLGDDDIGVNKDAPVQVTGSFSVSDVQSATWLAAGYQHTCAIQRLTSDVYCWGDDTDAALGPSGSGNSASPLLVISGANYSWSGIASGFGASCVLASGANLGYSPGLYCWGRNAEGQLGLGWVSAKERIPGRAIP